MSEYKTKDLLFDLPSDLKDKTVHVFAPDNEKEKEFTFVISRTLVDKKDTPEFFVKKLKDELSKNMNNFELNGLVEKLVDGIKASELSYTWVAGDRRLSQRQTIILLDNLNHKKELERVAVCLIGTCHKTFASQWADKYNSMIASVKLNKPVKPEFKPAAVDLRENGPFFLFASNKYLKVFPHVQSIYEFCTRNYVDLVDSKCFDQAGKEMFLGDTPEHQAGHGWKNPRNNRTEVFWIANPKTRESLTQLLPEVNQFFGLGSLTDISVVENYLRLKKKEEEDGRPA